MELMDVATPVRGDGNWQSRYDYDAPGCAMHSSTADICDGDVRYPLTNGDVDPDEASQCGVKGYPFGVITSIRTRARDLVSNPGDWVRDAMDAESEKALGRFLFLGVDGAGTVPDPAENIAWLGADGIATVPSGTDGKDSTKAALDRFWETSTGVKSEDTLLHLGLEVVWELGVDLIGDDHILKGTKIRVVTSPGYPTDAIAVTGPITLRLGSDQGLEEYNRRNDRENEVTRIVALEFDPCHAVRVE